MKAILSLAVVLITTMGFSQREAEPKVDQVEIRVSAVCDMCKDRIEEELNYTKGVVFAEVNLEKGTVLIKYKTKHLSADQLRKKITMIGYSADDMPANKEAFANLPKCCQSEGACEAAGH